LELQQIAAAERGRFHQGAPRLVRLVPNSIVRSIRIIHVLLLVLSAAQFGHAQDPVGDTGSMPSGAAARAGYPVTNLSSGRLKAWMYLPQSQTGYYRGTRFDWSGLVSRVEYGGHSFFCEFKQEHDPLNHDDICGTAEEFGIESPPSYAETKAGEAFIKIGIGVLEKTDDSAYAFWKRYRIQKPGSWNTVTEPGKMTFHQDLQGPNGWSYDYTKTVELAADVPELRIKGRLKNTGTKTIDTDHYGHNFSRIDDVPAGTNYTLEFPFAPRLGPDSKTQGCLEVTGRSLHFTKNPAPDQAIWVRLDGFERREDNAIRIVNHATKSTLSIITDQPLSKLVFYSSGGVLCPEPFIKLNIPPGQTREWTTTYRFEVDAR
jgi:hypothetical protein